MERALVRITQEFALHVYACVSQRNQQQKKKTHDIRLCYHAACKCRTSSCRRGGTFSSSINSHSLVEISTYPVTRLEQLQFHCFRANREAAAPTCPQQHISWELGTEIYNSETASLRGSYAVQDEVSVRK